MPYDLKLFGKNMFVYLQFDKKAALLGPQKSTEAISP